MSSEQEEFERLVSEGEVRSAWWNLGFSVAFMLFLVTARVGCQAGWFS